ncbi:MAG TPA: hypothetical protein VGK33_19490 [Chloroflexota bacterium]|jgi:hypothetical protein
MLGAFATTVYARLRLWHTVVPSLAMAVSTGHALVKPNPNAFGPHNFTDYTPPL